MQDCKEDHRSQDEGDWGCEDEYDGEEEVVSRVLHEKEGEELNIAEYWEVVKREVIMIAKER